MSARFHYMWINCQVGSDRDQFLNEMVWVSMKVAGIRTSRGDAACEDMIFWTRCVDRVGRGRACNDKAELGS